MKLFQAIPSDIFSVLASPNRALYADALDVLYGTYKEHLKIEADTLYSVLRSRLEYQLSEATFEGEDIDEEELRDVSGRARFLIRKLCAKGWFEKERGEDFKEYIIVPSYSSQILELLSELQQDSTMRGYSYVFNTYSSLKVAQDSGNAYEKMMALYSAYDNTQSLLKLLKTVYHNIRRFFQAQLDMQDLGQVLETHYEDFGQRVIETYIRPLKIKDSVPKYRVPIQSILDLWLEDPATLLTLSQVALNDGRGESIESCRGDLLGKIYQIKDAYDRMEVDFLEEIDRQVRRYTRATTQKIENLTNRDQNLRGNLSYLLTTLSQNPRDGILTERIQGAFTLTQQGFLSEKSLWYRKRPGKRQKSDPISMEDVSLTDEARAELEGLVQTKFSKTEVRRFMEARFGEEKTLYSKDIGLTDDDAYVMSLLVAMEGNDTRSFYQVDQLEGSYTEGPYTMPQMRLTRKEGT